MTTPYRNRLFAIILLLALAALACGLSDEQPPPADSDASVATFVAQTMQAKSAPPEAQPPPDQPPAQPPGQSPPAPTPTKTPTGDNGTVSGVVCYPSEAIPAMNAYFLEVGTQNVAELPIAVNQGTYTIDLPPGTYIAFAWLPDFSLGGHFSHAVPCGLTAACADHSPIQFNVQLGQVAANVDLCDWYSQFDVPRPPGVAVAEVTGAITGSLSYPSEGIPALEVVAFEVNQGFWYSTDSPAGASTYTISNLPPGTYNIVAYNPAYSISGGYTAAVPCGLSSACTDHTLLPVTVVAGQTTGGINPADWYAPPGTFPANPVP